jgi:hypothetical protein
MNARAFVDMNVLLYSEDFLDGQRFGTLEVQNPFREDTGRRALLRERRSAYGRR